MSRPRIYGNESRFRSAVARYIDGAEDLLEQAIGVRKRFDAWVEEWRKDSEHRPRHNRTDVRPADDVRRGSRRAPRSPSAERCGAAHRARLERSRYGSARPRTTESAPQGEPPQLDRTVRRRDEPSFQGQGRPGQGEVDRLRLLRSTKRRLGGRLSGRHNPAIPAHVDDRSRTPGDAFRRLTLTYR